MTDSDRKQRIVSTFRICWIGLLYVLVASAVMHAYMEKHAFNQDKERIGLELMLSQQAHKPFVLRVLSPLIVKTVSDLIPSRLMKKMSDFLTNSSSLLIYRHRNESWSPTKSVHFHVAYAYCFGCILLGMLVARRLAQHVRGIDDLFSDLAPAVALMFYPLAFVWGAYMYDFAEQLLLCAALVCIFERRLRIYYLVFVLAILNKESNVLLVLFFAALSAGVLERNLFLKHLVVQIVIAIALLVLVRYYFRGNPGEGVENHLLDNLAFWLSPGSYFAVFEGYAPLIPLPQGLHILTLFLIGYMLYAGWGRAPVNIRRYLCVSLAVNIPLVVAFGYYDEVRAFSLSFPALYIFACYAISETYRRMEVA